MFHRRIRNIFSLHEMFIGGKYEENLNRLCAMFSTGSSFTELPRRLKKSERKPMVTSVNELKRRARLEKHERLMVREVTLSAPENGLLVKGLVPVAHQVLAARAELLACASRVVVHIPIHYCSLCGEVHVGDPPHKIKTCNVIGSLPNKEHVWEKGGLENVLPVVESFHLYDRIGRAVSHNERLQVERIPAIIELCVQAGVDILEYPTRRREFPVYRVAGRMLDFEKRFPNDVASVKDINEYGFWESKKKLIQDEKSLELLDDDLQAIHVQVSRCVGWKHGKKCNQAPSNSCRSMLSRRVGTVQRSKWGLRGHRVRQCQAFKHQMRDGQHAWQEATIDDLIPPVYVWHVQDPRGGGLLVDGLKRYYEKLPAVVEMFAQAGARVGENYSDVMREDIAVPRLDEERLVV